MQIGTIGNREIVLPDYKIWGIKGDTTIKSKNLSQLEINRINKRLMNLNILNVHDYKLITIHEINLYQGNFMPNIKCVLLRFKSSRQACDEAISAIFDYNNKLLGFTKSTKKFQTIPDISYQIALEKGVCFLKDVAPDLIPCNTIVPQLNKVDLKYKIEFKPPYKLGNTKLNWIDIHIESLYFKQNIKLYGIKIKLFIPKTKLWAWIIVSNDGDIITFERDISWNFNILQRETQMWLHEQWLQKQYISLSSNIDS